MTTFVYEARGPSGQSQRGAISAPNRSAALERLRQRHLTPLKLQARSNASALPRLDGKAARDLARTLAQLLRAGLSFSQALKFASEELSPAASAAAARMREVAEMGEPASAALDDFGGAEARLLKGVIAAGETSGRLADALEMAAASFTRSAELRGRIGTALIYPSFVIFATLATLACFLLLVVPTLGQAFTGAEERLPASTRGLLELSAWLQSYGAVATLGLAGIALLIASNKSARASITQLLDEVLASPAALGVSLRLEFATFASLAALSLEAGVPMAPAFDAAAIGVKNGPIRMRIQNAVAAIRVGERPSLALERLALPPKSFLRLVHVGEETGKLAETLKQASALLASEAEQRLERLGAIAGPIITLALGSVVAGVVMSLFLGLLAMSDLATA